MNVKVIGGDQTTPIDTINKTKFKIKKQKIIQTKKTDSVR